MFDDEEIIDEEMEQMLEERKERAALTKPSVDSVQIPTATEFAQKMDAVKESVLVEASENDEHFVKTIKENVKDAAVTYTEVEQEKARLSKQAVQYEQEKLSTQQQGNEHKALEDKWENREKKRQYHYNGVKPIMKFVGIEEPMNLLLLYFLTVVLVPFYLASKLIRGTVGTIIAGACDDNRPKAVKGFLWTLIGVFGVCVMAIGIYLFLKWQKII